MQMRSVRMCSCMELTRGSGSLRGLPNGPAAEAGPSACAFWGCPLQNGAASVIGVDVGYGQVGSSVH